MTKTELYEKFEIFAEAVGYSCAGALHPTAWKAFVAAYKLAHKELGEYCEYYD